MYSKDHLVILDADGTTVDAFSAIERTFACHNMDIGDLERFQKRRHLFKYLGGLKEFPKNLKQQLGKQKRAKLISTLTEIYREEAQLYEDLVPLVKSLLGKNGLRAGLITRNITIDPLDTLRRLFERHGIDARELDFIVHIPLREGKLEHFREVRDRYRINPAKAYACGDEKKDFEAAIGSGLHPFMVSYGFEDFERLTKKIGVPPEIISRSPSELHDRIKQTFELEELPGSYA